MSKYDLNNVACNFIEITLPVNLLHIFRTPFPQNTSEWLLLKRVAEEHVIILGNSFQRKVMKN